MVRYENQCVDCHSELGCKEYCELKHVPFYSCDCCDADEAYDGVEIYEFDGKHYCPSCLLEQFTKVSA